MQNPRLAPPDATAGQLHPGRECDATTAVAVGALFSNRLLRLVLGRDAIPVTDEGFVATWVDMVHNLIAT
jgi:hypothetical protein